MKSNNAKPQNLTEDELVAVHALSSHSNNKSSDATDADQSGDVTVRGQRTSSRRKSTRGNSNANANANVENEAEQVSPSTSTRRTRKTNAAPGPDSESALAASVATAALGDVLDDDAEDDGGVSNHQQQPGQDEADGNDGDDDYDDKDEDYDGSYDKPSKGKKKGRGASNSYEGEGSSSAKKRKKNAGAGAGVNVSSSSGMDTGEFIPESSLSSATPVQQGKKNKNASIPSDYQIGNDALPNAITPKLSLQDAAIANYGSTLKSGDKRNLLTGLRNSSAFVLSYVQQAGTTTYADVADSLVADYLTTVGENKDGDETNDSKNLRRRVYDILNVLVVMGLVIKAADKRIFWKGYQVAARVDDFYRTPTIASNILKRTPDELKADVERTRQTRKTLNDLVMDKKQLLADLVKQQINITGIVSRNQANETTTSIPEESKIPLPFIVVNTLKDTSVECEMTENRSELFLNFSNSFEIHDDNDVLQRMKVTSQLSNSNGNSSSSSSSSSSTAEDEASWDQKALDSIILPEYRKYLPPNFP